MAGCGFCQYSLVQALFAKAVLPAALFGPVDLLHGFHRLMAWL